MPRLTDARQGMLFGGGPRAGSLALDAQVRAALAAIISGNRETIAVEMERLLGNDPETPVSRSQFDAWTAPSRGSWRFPAAYLPALTVATKDASLLRLLAEASGYRLVGAEMAGHLRKAELLAARRAIDKEIQVIDRAEMAKP